MARSYTHDELSKRFSIWLFSRSTGKGYHSAQEATIDNGYIADRLSLLYLNRETHFEFGKALGMIGKNSYPLDYGNGTSENIEFDYPSFSNYCSFIGEAKATRADFLNTFGGRDNGHKNRLEPRANFHFIIASKGIVKPEEVPDFWGLMEPSGGGLRIVKYAKHLESNNSIHAETILWKWNADGRMTQDFLDEAVYQYEKLLKPQPNHPEHER